MQITTLTVIAIPGRAAGPHRRAVLWHEFTHVVTLTATKNKMPRWLSEGISVHEERQARASYDTDTLQEAKTTAQVADDIAGAFAAFLASKDQLARMEGPRRDDGGILESARGAYVHAEQQYFAGNIGFIDYRYAYQTWIATKTEEFNDKANYWTAVYELEEAVARDLR